jgi:hypothetical protein
MIPQPTEASNLSALVTSLDSATHDQRVTWLRSLNKRQLVRLYALAEGTHLPVHQVRGEEGEVVIHHGKNSLPAFTHFQKRMIFTGSRIQGYNEQTFRWFTGPGHFLVRPSDHVEGELWLDYTWEPDHAPHHFPGIKSNMAGTSRLVYGGMIDVLRKVSDHVTIGAAIRGGKPSGDYFGLCRD